MNWIIKVNGMEKTMTVIDKNWTYLDYFQSYLTLSVMSNFEHLIVLSYRLIFRPRKSIYRNGLRRNEEKSVQLIT